MMQAISEIRDNLLLLPFLYIFSFTMLPPIPHHNIILKGIPESTSLNLLTTSIHSHASESTIKAIRHLPHKKGIAFVEFANVDCAAQFLTGNNGVMWIGNERVRIEYSRDEDRGGWTCTGVCKYSLYTIVRHDEF
jgi:RNA recognition motif-containing protein